MANNKSASGGWLKGAEDIVIILVCAVVFIPLAVFTTGAWRTAFSLPFVLFFPGYTLISALFPGKRKIDGMERLALSLGISLAVVPLIGLVLNFLPGGITPAPILWPVFGFILIMSAIALYRGSKLLPEERFTVDFGTFFRGMRDGWRHRTRLDRALTVVLTAAILGTIGGIIYIVQSPQSGEQFTEFYILGPEGKADNYPREVILGVSSQVIVGIVNHEIGPTTYNISIDIDGENVQSAGPVTLQRDGKWEQAVTFNATKTGDNQTVNFQLYRSANITPYRSLHLFLNVRER